MGYNNFTLVVIPEAKFSLEVEVGEDWGGEEGVGVGCNEKGGLQVGRKDNRVYIFSNLSKIF